MIHPFTIELYNQHKGKCVVMNKLGEEQVIIATDSHLVLGYPVKAKPKSQDPDIDAYRLYTANGRLYSWKSTAQDLFIEIEDETTK